MKYTSISIRITDEDKALLDEMIAEQGTTISELIRCLIRSKITQNGIANQLQQQQELLTRILKYSIRSAIALPEYVGITNAEATPKEKADKRELKEQFAININQEADKILNNNLKQVEAQNA